MVVIMLTVIIMLMYRILYTKFATSQGLVVQSLISAKPGLTLKKTCTVNLGLALIQLWTTGPWPFDNDNGGGENYEIVWW